jgi:hypothetical protein
LRSASSSSAQHPSSPASPSSPSVATPFAAKLANKYFNDPPQPSPASSSWRNQRPSSNYTAPAFGRPPSLSLSLSLFPSLSFFALLPPFELAVSLVWRGHARGHCRGRWGGGGVIHVVHHHPPRVRDPAQAGPTDLCPGRRGQGRT